MDTITKMSGYLNCTLRYFTVCHSQCLRLDSPNYARLPGVTYALQQFLLMIGEFNNYYSDILYPHSRLVPLHSPVENRVAVYGEQLPA